MKIPSAPFTVVDWSKITPTEHVGQFVLSAGMSYHVADFGDAAQRSYAPKGAKLFIVD